MKQRVTFEVDTVMVFDTLRTTGDWHLLGMHLISVMLTGDKPSFREALGMEMHGIKHHGTEKLS